MSSRADETLAAFSKADADGEPLFRLKPGHAGHSGHGVPFLSYTAGAYLGRLVEVITKQAPEGLNLDPVYETDMAEGLKAMALEGHGLAFLPVSSVKKELKSRRLVRASAPGMLELTMEVRMYRELPELSRHTGKPSARALWNFLKPVR